MKLRYILVGAWLTLLGGGCVLLEGTSCACGIDLDAPISEHDLSFEGDHTVADACICRCGSDPPTQHPADRTCSDYQAACTDERGQKRLSSCN